MFIDAMMNSPAAEGVMLEASEKEAPPPLCVPKFEVAPLLVPVSVDEFAAVAAVSSGGGSPQAYSNAGWSYYTSGAQGTTLAKGSHTIEFTSAMGLAGPAYLRVTQQLA